MPVDPPEKHAVTFIDGQNLYHAVKESFGYPYPNYDVLPLSQAICEAQGWRLKEARFYTGVPDASDGPFWNAFWTAKLAQMGRKGGGTPASPRNRPSCLLTSQIKRHLKTFGRLLTTGHIPM